MRRLPPVLLVVLAGLVAHAFALRGGFHYDDEHVILLNRAHLEDPGTIVEMFEEPGVFSGIRGNRLFRPVTHATHVLDTAVGGWGDPHPPPLPWHLTNLVLHVLVAAAVFAVTRRIVREWTKGAAFAPGGIDTATLVAVLAGTWFAVHPLNSEVVNYISARSESLAALFLLLAVWAHHAAWDAGRARGPRAALVAASLLAAALSFGSKETGILLPAIVGAVELWGRGGTTTPGPRFRAGVVRALPLAAAMGGWLLLRRAVLSVATIDLASRGAMSGVGIDPMLGGGRSMTAHLLTQARVVVQYALRVVFPVDLAPDHGVTVRSGLDGPTAIALLLLAAAVVAVVVAARRGSRAIPLAAAWAVCAVAPSVLVPLNVVMNEHRMYLPMTGLAIAAGWGGLALLRGFRAAGRAGEGAAAVALVLAGCVAIDIDRSRDWEDPGVLWSRAVETSPGSWRAHLHLGVERFRDGVALVERAERIDTTAPGGAEEQALLLARAETTLDEAEAAFAAGHALYPRSFDTRLNLGFFHLFRGRLANRGADPLGRAAEPEHFDRAVEWFTLAEESSPNSFRALYNRASALAEGGHWEEALAEFERLAAGDDARTTLYAWPIARLLQRLDRAEEALPWLDRIAAVAPAERGDVALLRGEILTGLERFVEAKAALEVAQRELGLEDRRPPLYMARMLAATGDERNLPLVRMLWDAALERGHRPGEKDGRILDWIRRR